MVRITGMVILTFIKNKKFSHLWINSIFYTVHSPYRLRLQAGELFMKYISYDNNIGYVKKTQLIP